MLSRLFGSVKVSDKTSDEQAPSLAEPQHRGQGKGLDVSFTADYPFPCLWDARDDDDDDDDEDDVITGSLDELEAEDQVQPLEANKLRLSSVGPMRAVGADGQELADYALHLQHRKDGKEGLPANLSATPGSLRSNFITQELLSRLPRGLDEEQKVVLSSSVPMSPIMSQLGKLSTSVPQLSASGSRTSQGQRLRRGLLKGAVVAFVTSGYSGKRFVFEAAKDLGVRSIILDGPDNWSQVLKGDGIIERFIPVDFGEVDTVFDTCLQALQKVRDEIGLDAVCTFNEFAVPIVARLAERLGLPGNPPEACDWARDKRATREIMSQAGLPNPKSAMIYTDEDITKAATTVGFPAVIKPITAAASMGVVRADNVEDLRTKVATVRKQMDALRLDDQGNIIDADSRDDTEVSSDQDSRQAAQINAFFNKTLMMEEYLDGDEVDCDLVFSGGVCTYGAVTDNWPTIEPYFNETGSNCPSILSRTKQAELMDLAVKSAQALGFQLGVLHVELKATSRGPRLIEVNARMGGGGVRDINLLVWGVDLVEQHLIASCGMNAKPLIAKRPLLRLAEYSINAPRTGTIKSVDFLAPWQGLPSTLYARPLVKPGEKVISIKDGMPTWVCEICVTAATTEEAIEYVKGVEHQMTLDIE